MQNKREKCLIVHGKIHCTQYAKAESKKEGREKERKKDMTEETNEIRGRAERKNCCTVCAHSHVQLSLSLCLFLSR